MDGLDGGTPSSWAICFLGFFQFLSEIALNSLSCMAFLSLIPDFKNGCLPMETFFDSECSQAKIGRQLRAPAIWIKQTIPLDISTNKIDDRSLL
jgi:hypothetical protein